MQRIDRSSKLVATWLLIGVGMTIIQIALGGITRLTGSGLSITEWDVVTGSLPPLNEQQWMIEFNKYRQTPQFQYLNFEFTLPDFKFIFFWEWFHRLWARTIGLVFVVGFIYFIIKKHFKQKMLKPLILLFVLGALQGGIGWIMVASGSTSCRNGDKRLERSRRVRLPNSGLRRRGGDSRSRPCGGVHPLDTESTRESVRIRKIARCSSSVRDRRRVGRRDKRGSREQVDAGA